MIGALAVLLAAAVAPPEILAVRASSAEGRPALHLLANGPLAEPVVERAGDEVQVTLEAEAPAELALPEPEPPLLGLRLEAVSNGSRLTLQVAPGTPCEVRRAGSLLTVLLGSAPGAQATASPVEQLYGLLFPAAEEPSPLAGEATPVAAARPEEPQGWRLGSFLVVRPGLVFRFVDASSTFLDTPEPTRARYFELDPELGALTTLSLGAGHLTASYEPRVRRGPKSLPVLRRVSHFADVNASAPIGASFWLGGRYHFAKGALEADEVDPGREYFFRLASFKRHDVALDARTEFGGRVNLVAGAALDNVDLAPEAGFVDHENRRLSVGLRYELSPSSHARLEYQYDRVPPSDQRALIESRAHSLWGRLDGEIAPLLTGRLGLGLRRQDNPRAPAAGNRYRGLTAEAQLKKEFSRGAHLALAGGRSTEVSAFESNAFYVANSLQATLTLPLPWSLSGLGGLGYHRNDYRLRASAIGLERRDTIKGWSLGLGRPLNRYTFVRADYRRDTRSSNVPGLSTRTWLFTAQLGIGFHGIPQR